MDDDYTKKNDWLSQYFVDAHIYNCEDVFCDPIHLFVSIPIWQNPNTLTLDISEEL